MTLGWELSSVCLSWPFTNNKNYNYTNNNHIYNCPTFIQVLAKKMTVLYKLAKEQLSKQYHYDFGLRALKSVVLVMAGELKRGSAELAEVSWGICSFSVFISLSLTFSYSKPIYAALLWQKVASDIPSSYWCFHILPSALFFQAKFYA